MSRDPLPEHLDLRRLAARQAVIEGVLPGRVMSRLAGGEAGEVRVSLRFSLDSVRRVMIQGEASTEVPLQCQRCLDAFSMPVRAEIRLVKVASETEAESLGDEFEPLLSGEDTVRTVDLLEDELILALPIVPLHDAGECEPALPKEAPAVEEPVERPNPFAALQQLKRSKD